MELPIGTSVHCLDGECGDLERVVVDPENGRVCLIVVRRQGRLVGVPLGEVRLAELDRVEIGLVRSDVDGLPDHEVRGLVSPAAGWAPPPLDPDEEVIPQPVPHPAEAPTLFPLILVPGEPLVEIEARLAPEGAIDLGKTPVEATDGEVGHVAGVGVDHGDHVSHLVVRRGRDSVVVPLRAVALLTGDAVRLRLDRRGFERLAA